MLQKILIFSPLIALFLLSLVIFVCVSRSYRFRIEKRSVDPNNLNITSIIFGAMLLAGSGSMLLFAFTLSRTIFLVLFLFGIILFLVGDVTLRKLVIAGKEYIFSLSATIIGMTLIALNFPFLINIHEPFTIIYIFIIVTVIAIQIVALESWKKKRKHETSISIEKQLRE